MGKIQGQRILKNRIKHFNNRLLERFGFSISEFEYFSLVDQIILKQSKFILRISRDRTLHKVLVENIWVPVIYSKRHKIVITTMKNSWIQERRGKLVIIPKKQRKYKPKKQRVPWQLKSKWSREKCEEMGIY